MQENLLKIRRELEQFEIKKDQAIQSVVNSNQNELIHFKRMVSNLRDEMENEKHNFEESRQNELLLKEKEFKQLQSTIVELRTKLETKNGRKKRSPKQV